MTNKEIHEKILYYQTEMLKAISGSGTFELKPEILEYKKAIDKLRKQCSHVNEEGKFEFTNGTCIYCGAKQ